LGRGESSGGGEGGGWEGWGGEVVWGGGPQTNMFLIPSPSAQTRLYIFLGHPTTWENRRKRKQNKLRGHRKSRQVSIFDPYG